MQAMSDPKKRPGTEYLGTVPTGTVLTPETIADLMARRPRQEFDIEIKANEPKQITPATAAARPGCRS